MSRVTHGFREDVVQRTEYAIPCTIERGGFTSERTFEVDLGPDGTLTGIANVDHLRTLEGRPLDDDVPGEGERIEGVVKCRVVRVVEGGRVLVEVPSAQVVHVPDDSLQAVPA